MKICFFCKVQRPEILKIVEFYNQDIQILRSLDSELTIATSYKQIDWSADLIFVWWWTYAFLPVLVMGLKRKPVIITGTFNYKCPEADSDFFRRPLWQRILIKFSARQASGNIFVSKNEFEQIMADWKLKNSFYSPHCINTDKYLPQEQLKKKPFLFTICWTGKENVKRKCLYEIIDSIELIKKNKSDILLYIAGHKGDAFADIQAYINNKKLNKNIILLGEISEEEKIIYLQTCSCYLQPSRYEGFGLAIAEAMSCGATVISTPVGEVPNVVGDAGVLIRNADPQLIANAINTVLTDETQKLNENPRERILKKFSIKRRKEEIVTIINSYLS